MFFSRARARNPYALLQHGTPQNHIPMCYDLGLILGSELCGCFKDIRCGVLAYRAQGLRVCGRFNQGFVFLGLAFRVEGRSGVRFLFVWKVFVFFLCLS